MTSSLVLTVIGPDRPGLVEALSQVVAEQFSNKFIRRNIADGDEGSGKTEELIHEPTVNRLFMLGS